MVFNAATVAAAVNLSAELCQYVACNPERMSGREALYLVCCLPIHHLRRLALCLFSFFCFPISFDNAHLRPFRRSSSASSSSEGDSSGYDSHSE